MYRLGGARLRRVAVRVAGRTINRGAARNMVMREQEKEKKERQEKVARQMLDKAVLR